MNDLIEDLNHETDPDEWEYVESGPFCVHMYECCDCDEICTNCGHPCGSHIQGQDCHEIDCDCEKYEGD